MMQKHFRRKFLTRTVLGETLLRTVLRLLGLLVLAFLVFSPARAQTNLTSLSLLNAFKAYVQPAPAAHPLPTKVGIPTGVGTIVKVSAPINTEIYVRGPTGPQGPQGPQGIQGHPGPAGPSGSSSSSSVTYIPSNSATNFGGASIFSVTDLSSNKLITETGKITTLEVSCNSTLTGTLNVGGAITGNLTGNVTGNLTGNITGNAATVTTNANLTGVITSIGNATSLGSFTSANLITALTDETGGGALVFANTPTLVTPILGVATGTSLSLGGGTALTTTNQTGTGNLVLATSPTLVTPILGVASATSLTASGQGALQVGPYGSSAGNTGEGRFLELLANGSNYTGFKSPDLLAGNVIYTLQSADGTDGQVLSTNGAGVLSWTTKTEGRSEDFKGLSLRTSPNADVAATTVVLDHADEIVMDTGNRVATWDDLSAIITTSGAGGLNTGAEAASTWYEIYAIRKSSDGTKNLLLHRAKDYFLDEDQSTSDASSEEIRKSSTTRTSVAQ